MSLQTASAIRRATPSRTKQRTNHRVAKELDRIDDYRPNAADGDKEIIAWIDTNDPNSLSETVYAYFQPHLGDLLLPIREDPQSIVLANVSSHWVSKSCGEKVCAIHSVIYALNHYWIISKKQIEQVRLPLDLTPQHAVAYAIGQITRPGRETRIRLSRCLARPD